MKRVLLVDDSMLVRRIAEAMLRGEYEVVTAASAPEAFNKAVAERPDLILTDLNLPGWDGQQLRAALADDARTRHIKVVIVTTEGHLQRLGPNVDCLLKPFDRSSLLGKVVEYLH